jgi:hypothetical protein
VGVNVRVGPISYPIGRAEFLGAFFDTIAVRVEGGLRGSRLPVLATFYGDATLDAEAAITARDELAVAHTELSKHPPAAVVWDVDDPAACPPWGDEVAGTITSLADYFVTSDGRPLMAVLDTALEASIRTGLPIRIS